MKVGDKAIYKFQEVGEWHEKECTIEEIGSDYITVRIPGTPGGTLHFVDPMCLRVV